MDVLPVDLVALVSAIMGISIVLFPVIGLTIRFALKPTVEALGRFFEHKGLDDNVQIMERRMALMEQQIQSLESRVAQLVEVTEFHNQLRSGPQGALQSGSDAQEGGGKPVG
ncbi:MAG: hypothetical protein LJF04_18815 [Gemmatimonadetes bacterium]|nr:hypothetical protein [Gemmatimonadota bacterium]